jgi:hypothetical protein
MVEEQPPWLSHAKTSGTVTVPILLDGTGKGLESVAGQQLLSEREIV